MKVSIVQKMFNSINSYVSLNANIHVAMFLGTDIHVLAIYLLSSIRIIIYSWLIWMVHIRCYYYVFCCLLSFIAYWWIAQILPAWQGLLPSFSAENKLLIIFLFFFSYHLILCRVSSSPNDLPITGYDCYLISNSSLIGSSS